ncbi:MAG UNVERIFIED_CONTAM: hypothetical protein LVR18_10500 [Planctomycetaceae bacterium]
MFDDDHGISGFDEALEHFDEFFDVSEMQTGGGLVKQIQRFSGGAFAELAGQFDPLGFTAGKRGRRLSQLHVVEPDIPQCAGAAV